VDLSQWAEQQISIAKLYRNLSQENPVTLSIESGGQSFSVVVSYTEPGFDVPFNVVWVCAGELFYGAVLRRVSAYPFSPFQNQWTELATVNDVFAELQYWSPQGLLQGEIEQFTAGPASMEQPGIFRLTKGLRAVCDTDPRLTDAREPLPHSHDPTPAKTFSVGGVIIDVSNSRTPDAGDVLVITGQREDGVLIGEWLTLMATDILYTGPWPVGLVINGPTDPVDEMTQVQFTADLQFEDGSVKRISPNWQLSNLSVGTLDANGVFQSYNISANVSLYVVANYVHAETESVFSATFPFVVKEIDSTLVYSGLEIIGPTKLSKGEVATYSVNALFDNGIKRPVAPDLWMVANAGAGSITQSGIFTAAQVIGNQTTKITAMYTYLGQTKQATLNVEIVDTTVYPSSAAIIGPDTVDENTSATYQLEVTYINGRKQLVAVSDWAHSNPNAGTINSLTGRFVAPDLNSNESTTITASYTVEGVTVAGSKDVSVLDTTVYPILIDILGPDFVVEGQTAQFRALVHFTDGSSDYVQNNWSIDTQLYGTLDTAGLFTAVPDVDADKPVVLSTSYALNGKSVSASKTISVKTSTNYPVSAIIESASSVNAGESTSLSFIVTYTDGTTARMNPTWELSNSNLGSISPYGLFTANLVNDTAVETIKGTYSASGQTVTAQFELTINDTIARPVSALISGPTSVRTTNTETFALDVKFSDGITRRVSASWQSSDPAVGTINSAGTFTPYSVGTTTLTAVYTAQGITVSNVLEITVI
jgi:hypothetical protein